MQKSQLIRLGTLGSVVFILAIIVVCNALAPNESNIVPNQRTAFDFWVRWRCLDCGHEFEDYAAIGPRECPSCGDSSAFVSAKHLSSGGRTLDVAINYDKEGRVAQYKFSTGDWVPAIDRSQDPPRSNLFDPETGDSLLAIEPQRMPPDAEPLPDEP